MSSDDGTAGALTEFFDYVAAKGLMNKRTAAARKSASTKLLEIDADWQRIDLRSLDVNEQISRFQNLRKANYTPKSLGTYAARFRSAVEEYLAYLDDPSAFRSPSDAQAVGSRSAQRAETDEGRASSTGIEPSATTKPMVISLPSSIDGPPRVPTLVAGLLERLPGQSAQWAEDDLQTWLQLAEIILRTVYVEAAIGGQRDGQEAQ